MMNYNYFKSKNLILFFSLFLIIILLVSCSKLSILNNNDIFNKPRKSNSNNGKGIEIDFQFTNLRTYTGELFYELSLKNSGFEDIVLTKENVKVKDIYSSKNCFKNLEDEIKNEIFSGSDKIYLIQGFEPLKISSNLDVYKKCLNDSFIKNLVVDFTLEFPYKTNINEQVSINLKNLNPLIFKSNLGDESAPVKISKIKSYVRKNNKIDLEIYLKKIDDVNIEGINDLENINLYLGTQKLDCEWKINKNLISNYFNDNAYLLCSYDVSNVNGKIDTILSGEIKYIQKITKRAKININTKTDKN